MPSFLRARLSAAAVISLSSPVLRCCFKVQGTLPPCTMSCKALPGHSVNVDSFDISYADILISQVRVAGASPPQCQLTVEDVFWNATILHTADVTQPSQSALSKQSIHTGKTSTRQDTSVGYFVLPGMPRIGRMLLRWNELCLLSCPAYVVHVSLPYSNVLVT